MEISEEKYSELKRLINDKRYKARPIETDLIAFFDLYTEQQLELIGRVIPIMEKYNYKMSTILSSDENILEIIKSVTRDLSIVIKHERRTFKGKKSKMSEDFLEKQQSKVNEALKYLQLEKVKTALVHSQMDDFVNCLLMVGKYYEIKTLTEIGELKIKSTSYLIRISYVVLSIYFTYIIIKHVEHPLGDYKIELFVIALIVFSIERLLDFISNLIEERIIRKNCKRIIISIEKIASEVKVFKDTLIKIYIQKDKKK